MVFKSLIVENYHRDKHILLSWINETIIFYKNVTDFDDVYKYDIVECLLPCLYNHLLKTEKEYISKKWKQECGIAKCYQLDRVMYFTLKKIIILSVLFSVFSVNMEDLLKWLKKK
uniref:Uncharacterized protein n=1 Tax=Strongyloides stercoralis TaxID=6248 RepID=A0AAF5DPE7_STRER